MLLEFIAIHTLLGEKEARPSRTLQLFQHENPGRLDEGVDSLARRLVLASQGHDRWRQLLFIASYSTGLASFSLYKQGICLGNDSGLV